MIFFLKFILSLNIRKPAGAAAFGRLPSGLPEICVAFWCFTPDEVKSVESLS